MYDFKWSSCVSLMPERPMEHDSVFCLMTKALSFYVPCQSSQWLWAALGLIQTPRKSGFPMICLYGPGQLRTILWKLQLQGNGSKDREGRAQRTCKVDLRRSFQGTSSLHYRWPQEVDLANSIFLASGHNECFCNRMWPKAV